MLYVLQLSGKNGFLKLLAKSKMIWKGVGKSDKVKKKVMILAVHYNGATKQHGRLHESEIECTIFFQFCFNSSHSSNLT